MRLLIIISTVFLVHHVHAQTASFAQKVVIVHNEYRQEVSVKPLVWDEQLAASAKKYAAYLAKTGKFEHSKAKGIGENLWMGTKGFFSVEQMIKDWGSEKSLFVNKPCPNFSTNGNFGDVGHYTQIIWSTTQKVGCAIVSSKENDYLVCHYKEPGNVIGQKAY